MAIRDTLGHPEYLGLQIDWPLFVHQPFSADGKDWKKNEEFTWLTRGIDARQVAQLYFNKFIIHDRFKVTEEHIGDRLNEMTSHQLGEVVDGLNMLVKPLTQTVKEFNAKKCKRSKIDDKQRGLIRQWLRRNENMQEDYDKIRDRVLYN